MAGSSDANLFVPFVGIIVLLVVITTVILVVKKIKQK